MPKNAAAVRSSRNARRGFVLVTMLVASAALMACVGLAIDAGHLQLVKSRMQTAADAAAIGGVQELRMNGSAHVADAAKADATRNGFTDGHDSVSVTVNMPPANGYYTGDATAVEAIVSQTVGTFFMGLIGSSSVTVRTRSVARESSGASCVYVLDPAASSALSASGGVIVNVGCGIMVDSSSTTAVNVSGGARLSATAIDIVGSYSVSGGSTVTPTPHVHVASQSDPLAYIPAPSVGACTQSHFSLSGGTHTLSPGVYCYGMSISGGSHATLNPGTYILLGGGLSLSGGSTLTGTGVTFYNTKDATHAFGQISISGGTIVQLTAPTTGARAGMLFFQDRSVTSGSGGSLSGGSGSIFNGALYFPGTSVSYSGGTTGSYTILVAKTVSFSGGSTLNADYSSLSGGSPIKAGAYVSE